MLTLALTAGTPDFVSDDEQGRRNSLYVKLRTYQRRAAAWLPPVVVGHLAGFSLLEAELCTSMRKVYRQKNPYKKGWSPSYGVLRHGAKQRIRNLEAGLPHC